MVKGQHRIQRQILSNFSFKGHQRNSRETWCLSKISYRPESRSVKRVGFFDVDCSEAVDQYITACEEKFKEPLHRFSNGEFTRADAGRQVYDFIAMHYVRSQAYRLQVKHVVSVCRRNLSLTKPQAEAEYIRLTSHQDVTTFQDLVDSVSRALTHYVLCPVLMTGPWSFITSDKIMYAVSVESKQSETMVWFPLSPSMGFGLTSEFRSGQILGPVVKVDRRSGSISFAKVGEAPLLQCQKPTPQDISEEVVNTNNGLMVQGSFELYSADRAAIDSALLYAPQPTGYRYQPIAVSRLI